MASRSLQHPWVRRHPPFNDYLVTTGMFEPGPDWSYQSLRESNTMVGGDANEVNLEP
jgi:hypothetical protein